MRPSKEERINFNVDYSYDSDFSAHARLLQSKWRERNNFPMGKLGNYIEVGFAKAHKCNYLTDNIKVLVSEKVEEAKKSGALISEPRIWDNLLSSQPLCFNLFGELSFDLELATQFFKMLFSDRITKVTSVNFEYSRGRGNKDYTGDHSAFDVFIEYINNDKKGFIGIEVKYAESLKEESEEKAEFTFTRHKTEYQRLTTDAVFKLSAIESLSKVPLSQIWRDHLLSIAHLKDYDEGFFVFLFPKANTQCQNAINEYKKLLISEDEKVTGFYPRHLDDFIKTIRMIREVDWTKELENRYLGN